MAKLLGREVLPLKPTPYVRGRNPVYDQYWDRFDALNQKWNEEGRDSLTREERLRVLEGYDRMMH